MTTEMVAYHGDPSLKAIVLADVATRRDPTGDYAEYSARWGIPEELVRLKDGIFENLPRDCATAWPERFLSAIAPGADLSGVYAAWSVALMLDSERGNITRCAGFPEAEAAVRTVGELWRDAASESAKYAASESAWGAVDLVSERSAAAESAWSAAASASVSVWSASCSEYAARSAAWSVPESERSAASVAHWCWMADLLIATIEAAPGHHSLSGA